MAEPSFTPEEVQALIPALTEIMEILMPLHEEHAELQRRLKAEQQRISLSGGGVLDRDAWRRDSARLQILARDIEANLQRIGALGGVPKDLGLGLVDFPHVRRGQIVNLCWKHGETEIRYWHGLDEGYAARKPL
jgi:hypothetical protein